MLNEFLVQASEPLVISFLGEDLRLEPMQRGRERDTRVSPLPRRQHPKRGVFDQSLGVVRVLVPGQAAIDRLTKQVGQRELAVASHAGSVRCRSISGLKPTLVQVMGQQQSGVGGQRRTSELDSTRS